VPTYDFFTLLTKTSKKLPAVSPDDLVVSIHRSRDHVASVH